MGEKGLNKWSGIGRVGADPEMRYTPNGDAVCNFNIACSEVWRDRQTGEKREKTEWIKCVVWGKRAEAFGEYVGKGSRIYIEGKIQTHSYEKDGNRIYVTEVKVDDFNFLDIRGGNNQGSGDGGYSSGPPAAGGMPGGDDDGDIPF